MLKNAFFFISSCFTLLFISFTALAKDNIMAIWIQYTSSGIEARAVVLGDCSMLLINNKLYL